MDEGLESNTATCWNPKRVRTRNVAPPSTCGPSTTAYTQEMGKEESKRENLLDHLDGNLNHRTADIRSFPEQSLEREEETLNSKIRPNSFCSSLESAEHPGSRPALFNMGAIVTVAFPAREMGSGPVETCSWGKIHVRLQRLCIEKRDKIYQ